ncbi:MAG: hypothetical protein QOE58_302 [Actinomycetota bacterium]|jgi:hypothetical protein|nr:hypothetical protein [Actinomycetota bacterium]
MPYAGLFRGGDPPLLMFALGVSGEPGWTPCVDAFWWQGGTDGIVNTLPLPTDPKCVGLH